MTHISGGKYHCSNCCKLYNTETELQQHVCVIKRLNTKQVKENKFECKTCGKLFFLKYILNRHIRCVHEKIKQTYRCKYKGCGVKKTSQEELYEHIRSDHPVRRYLCDTCPMSFNTSHQLESHKVSHNKDSRPYQCKYCEKKFGRSDILARHYIIHTGDKPYKCEVCEKKFNRRYHLNVHKLTHTRKNASPVLFVT